MPTRSSGSSNLVAVAPPGRHLRLVSLSLVLGCVVLDDGQAWPWVSLATFLALCDQLVVEVMDQLPIRAATTTASFCTSLPAFKGPIRLHVGTAVVLTKSLIGCSQMDKSSIGSSLPLQSPLQ